MVGLLMYVGVQLVASAVVASVFVRSLSVLVPSVGTGLACAVSIVAVYAVFATVNVRGGAKLGARVVEGITVAKLAPLVLLAVVALFFSRESTSAGRRSRRRPSSGGCRCGCSISSAGSRPCSL